MEEHLRKSGYGHTNLRPGFFAQNLESAYRADIIEDDRLYLPAGDSIVNWVDVRDVAEVASSILESPEPHRNENYTLVGPGPVSWSHVVDTLSRVLDRKIRYQPASVLGYVAHLYRRGLPAGAIAVQTMLHFLLRFGQGATQDPTLAELLGRQPRDIATYIEDHCMVWRLPAATEEQDA